MKRIIRAVPFTIPFAKKGNYYRAGNSTGYSTRASNLNRMYSQVMCFSEEITIDRLAIYVSTAGAAGSVARMGLYADDGTLHPGQLIYGSGEIDTTATGQKTAVPPSPIVIAKATPFWTCFLCGVASPKLKSSDITCRPALGTDNIGGGWLSNGFYADQAYGALPATHPASPFLLPGTQDYVHIRLA